MQITETQIQIIQEARQSPSNRATRYVNHLVNLPLHNCTRNVIWKGNYANDLGGHWKSIGNAGTLLTQVQSVQCTSGPCSDGPLFGKIANYDTWFRGPCENSRTEIYRTLKVPLWKWRNSIGHNFHLLLVVYIVNVYILHNFRDITTFTVCVTVCDLEKSVIFDTTDETTDDVAYA